MTAPSPTPHAIRILIAVREPDYRRALMDAIGSSRDASLVVVGDVGDGNDAVVSALTQLPDVVLAGDDLDRVPGVEVARRLRLDRPWLSVIVLSSDPPHGEMLLEGMEAGAAAVLSKQTSPQDLIQRIRKLGQEAQRRRQALERSADPVGASSRGAKVIAVYGRKGGIGRTLIASKLAYLLAAPRSGQPEPRVALCELGVASSDLPTLFEMTPQRTAAQLIKVYSSFSEQDALQVLQAVPQRPNMRLLFAPRVEEQQLEEEHVTSIIHGIRLLFDYIVIDTGAAFNRTTQAILRAASRVVLVVVPDILGLEGSKPVYRYIHRLGLRADLVINRFHPVYRVKDKQIASYIGFPAESEDPVHILDQPQSVRVALDTGTILPDNNQHELDFTRGLYELLARVRELQPTETAKLASQRR